MTNEEYYAPENTEKRVEEGRNFEEALSEYLTEQGIENELTDTFDSTDIKLGTCSIEAKKRGVRFSQYDTVYLPVQKVNSYLWRDDVTVVLIKYTDVTVYWIPKDMLRFDYEVAPWGTGKSFAPTYRLPKSLFTVITPVELLDLIEELKTRDNKNRLLN